MALVLFFCDIFVSQLRMQSLLQGTLANCSQTHAAAIKVSLSKWKDVRNAAP